MKEALEEGGWKLVRSKKHKCYRRMLSDGRSQNYSMSKTPSDERANKNALANLRKLNDSATPALEETDGRVGGIHCSICSRVKDEDSFSKSQLRKEKHKCKDCVSKEEQKEKLQ